MLCASCTVVNVALHVECIIVWLEVCCIVFVFLTEHFQYISPCMSIFLLAFFIIQLDDSLHCITIITFLQALHCKKWCVVLTQVRDYCGNYQEKTQEKTHICHNSHALRVKTTHHFLQCIHYFTSAVNPKLNFEPGLQSTLRSTGALNYNYALFTYTGLPF